MKIKYNLFHKHYNKIIGKFVIMNIRKLSVILLLMALVAIACSAHTETGVESQVYDTETDCLNGTMIVSLNGKYGLADTCGREILTPVYDDLYYISDEIAVAFSGEIVGFFDRSGKRLGETVTDVEATIDDLLGAYSKIEKARREQWDSILASYEELREYCKSDSASAGVASLMAEGIRAALQSVDGPMQKDQKQRLESEYSAYRR